MKKTMREKVSEIRKNDKKPALNTYDSKITKDIKIKGPQPEIEYLRDLMNIAGTHKNKTRHSMVIGLLEEYIEKNDLLK